MAGKRLRCLPNLPARTLSNPNNNAYAHAIHTKVNMPVQTLCMLSLQQYIKTEAPTSTDDLTVYPFKYDWSKVVLNHC